MNDTEIEKMTDISVGLTEQIFTILAGKPVEIQGAVLFQLIGSYMARYHPDWREDAINELIEGARGYSKIHVEVMIDLGLAPATWR